MLLPEVELGHLPSAVRGTVGGGELGAAMDVVDAGFGLIEAHQGVLLDGKPGVGAAGEWIDGHGFDVAGLNEVVEGLRGLLLVDGVGVNRLAEDVEVFFEGGFLRVADVAGVGGDGNSGEQSDDDHDDHEFEQGKALLCREAGACAPDWSDDYHVEYFVPSSAVPVLLVWTSKTF